MRMYGVKTTIAFVDDHPILVEGLKGLFSDIPSYSVIATGCSASEAWQIVEAHQPDVLFMDLSMPGDVFSAIAKIVKSPCSHQSCGVHCFFKCGFRHAGAGRRRHRLCA